MRSFLAYFGCCSDSTKDSQADQVFQNSASNQLSANQSNHDSGISARKSRSAARSIRSGQGSQSGRSIQIRNGD